ncbi:uncharacterized protein LOC141652689 isoform X2 [Silene latifolia]|uniref:uncharacterized protein LOC141652689 isoform X2 n=1 Tax=Silene latifolia TaxID=37657 RepID=UPI003D77225E
MEDSVKTVPSSVVSGKSKLRYPLRSASKSKSPEIANNSASVASKRGRPPSVSKSVSVLELSAKDKAAAKPPRRLSIPSPSVTPVSEARARRSANDRENCVTPLSDVSRSSIIRRKFSVLTSASYWLSQIKLSESAGKHSVSLGFFKLALEAGCETLQRLREELKSYARRHNLAEFEETVKSLFESYEITESLDQLQVSVTCSHVPEDATTPSGDDVLSTSSTVGTRKLKPKSLNIDTQASSANVSSTKDSAHRTRAISKMRTSVNRSPVKSDKKSKGSIADIIKKRVQRAGKQEPKDGDDKIKTLDESSEGAPKSVDMEEIQEENKENMDDPLIGEVNVIEGN